MPSRFQTLWSKHRPKLDALMAEPLLIIPMTRGEYLGATPDPSKPSFIANGICIIEDVNSMSSAVLAGTAEKTDVILGSPEVTFLPSQFDLDQRLIPPVGSRIERLTWPGSPSYEIISPLLVDSVGQLTARLSQVLEGFRYNLDLQPGAFATTGNSVGFGT